MGKGTFRRQVWREKQGCLEERIGTQVSEMCVEEEILLIGSFRSYRVGSLPTYRY